LLLFGKLAARGGHPILRLDVDGVGSGRLTLPCPARKRAALRACSGEPRGKSLQIALLIGSEVTRHSTSRSYADSLPFGTWFRERAAEDDVVADRFDRPAGADQIEVPEAIGGIAEQHGADEPVFGDDELLIDADTGIGEHDPLGAVCTHEVACGKNV